MTSDEKLVEMKHTFDTQGNESLNMPNAEVAPKHKNFSRTPSLNWRIQNVIGVHNSGYEEFYNNVMKTLLIDPTSVTTSWLCTKDKQKAYQKKVSQDPANRRKRVYKRNTKSREEILVERTKNPKIGTYGCGIGVHGSGEKKRKVANRGYCSCGGSNLHKNKNSKHCLLNKNSKLVELI